MKQKHEVIPVEEILSRVDLVALVARRVQLKKRGQEFWGCCPFHKENTPSFKVDNTRRRYKCFGCPAGGDAIDWMRETEGLGFIDAVKALDADRIITKSEPIAQAERVASEIEKRNATRASQMWAQSVPAPGTLVETYLRGRGIIGKISAELHFLPRCWHKPTEQWFPVMLSRLSDNHGFTSVQRTYLAADGRGKAPVAKLDQKRGLGGMRGGAVRLRPVGDVLAIAEGVETALSAAQLYQLATWATCGTGRFTVIDIPETVRFIIIFADAGEPGWKAAVTASDHYEALGYSVEIVRPDADFAGRGAKDFNNILQGAAA